MRLNEWIEKEFRLTADNEIERLFEKEQSEVLKKKLNDTPLLCEETLDLSEILNLVETDEHFSKLKNLGFLLENLRMISDNEYSSGVLESFEISMRQKPSNRLYPLFWIYQKLYSFEEDEYIDKEYADFIARIIENYDYLIKLEDFLFETYLLLSKPRWEKWSKDIFEPVFHLAAEKYPAKHAFKMALGFIYFQNKDYTTALPIFETIVHTVEKENKGTNTIGDPEFPYIDYLDCVQYTGIIHHILGDQDKSMKYINYVLNNLPIVHFDEDEKEMWGYVDSFFLRMRHNINEKNKEKVLEDYNLVKDFLSFGDWEEEYADVISYVSNNG